MKINNARPDFIFNFKEGIDNDEAKLIRTQWENTHRGNKNAGKVGVLSKGEVLNVGLSQKEILQNLCYLAKTVLEPIKLEFPSMIITSGWRNKTGTSQHNKGQAADIQVPGFTSQGYWNGAQWIKDNIEYDQFILEYGGRNPWFHVSTNSGGQRRTVLTMKGTGVFVNGLVRVI